ncbi:NADPH-dependent FMN reductase [Rhodopila sp.]|uniref:NADPH-dependent FMN reductase n=1 Tax=Rhodopila sp. TaxID=2480087 RepID=UPI002C098E85|nr:NADPH-dependent FMN reductase [Rhodopila sp.]HVZ06584.1 NADPH-dependent FMN reductase [Rhodopila sp.]
MLLISGSLRAGSVNAAVLKTAQQVAPSTVVTRLYQSLSELPHFNPDDDREPLNRVVAELRAEIGRADAILFSTPEYAGALPGSLKNLLDWSVGGVEMNGKPVAWINAASSAAVAGGEDAYASLRRVLGYVGAHIVEPACIRVPTSRQDVDADGTIRTSNIRSKIAASVATLANTAKESFDENRS